MVHCLPCRRAGEGTRHFISLQRWAAISRFCSNQLCRNSQQLCHGKWRANKSLIRHKQKIFTLPQKMDSSQENVESQKSSRYCLLEKPQLCFRWLHTGWVQKCRPYKVVWKIFYSWWWMSTNCKLPRWCCDWGCSLCLEWLDPAVWWRDRQRTIR